MTADQRLSALQARLGRRDELLRMLALRMGECDRFTVRDVWLAWLAAPDAEVPTQRMTAYDQIRKVLGAMESRGDVTTELAPDNRGVMRRYYERKAAEVDPGDAGA